MRRWRRWFTTGLLVGITVAIWWYRWATAMPSRPILFSLARLPLPMHIVTDFSVGKVVLVTVTDASRLNLWLGDELRSKRRMGDHALAVARSTDANAVMTSSFHWWAGDGFIVLGQVVRDGESLTSPNPDVLRWQRCYFAATWDGKFLIGETNLTTSKLLKRLPQVRHLVGGGGWLVKDGDAEAWRLAGRQGFRADITHSERERTVVAINADGSVAWLAVFAGQVSLRECARWLKQHLPVRHAVFFDGGRNAVLVVRSSDGVFQSHGASRPLPEVPCMIVVR